MKAKLSEDVHSAIVFSAVTPENMVLTMLSGAYTKTCRANWQIRCEQRETRTAYITQRRTWWSAAWVHGSAEEWIRILQTPRSVASNSPASSRGAFCERSAVQPIEPLRNLSKSAAQALRFPRKRGSVCLVVAGVNNTTNQRGLSHANMHV